MFSARTGVLTRTLVGHELGVWGLCLVSSGGHRLVDTDKPRAKKKTRTTGGEKVEGFDASSKKQKKFPTQDVRASSSQPTLRTLRAGVASINLHSLDGSDGMHVMPSESLESLVSPAMRIALGLKPLTDSEYDDSGGNSSHREDECLGTEARANSTKHSTTQRKNNDKPSSMCYASQGWGQPNSLIVSGGCDKVIRVWDAKSG